MHAVAGALAGRRVLEIADPASAYCGKLLADMGADVVLVEPPRGSAIRDMPPFYDDVAGSDRGLFFLYTQTSKRGITLDSAHPLGRPLLRRLALRADLVLEALPPGRIDALGIGHASLAAERPRIVVTSITGFGQTGPHRDWASTELIAAATGGTAYVTGEPDDPPVVLAGRQSQFVAGATAAASSLIALRHAGQSGRGQHVDISIQETTLAASHVSGVGKWLDDGIVPRRIGTALTASVPSGAYPCRDGRVYLTVNRPAHWTALARWIHDETDNQEVLDPMFEGPSSRRIEYRELLDVFISDMTRQHTVDAVFHEGQRRHIAFTPLYGAEEVVRDPHLVARHFFETVASPACGPVRMPGAPYRLSATDWAIRRPAPRLGEHDEAVYCGELGLTAAELARLREQGVVAA